MDNNDQQEKLQLVSTAKSYLTDTIKGEGVEVEKYWSLALELIKKDEFGWSRRLLDVLAESGVFPKDSKDKLIQKRALSTYKDPDLNRQDALDSALEMLREAFDLATTEDQETLGLTGAIHKRRWEIDGNKLHLERALEYYRRGFELGMKDDGYTAINAAFLQDLLAHLEERQATDSGGSSMTAGARRSDSRMIREAVIEALEPRFQGKDSATLSRDDYWTLATLAEACLGLQRFEETKNWLAMAQAVPEITTWEYKSTATQLVQLVQLQSAVQPAWAELERGPAWQALIEFLGENADALRTLFQGKLGLGLSGGGFRASLYHIGVLAKMAEFDLLRHVEIISCVSGGSIIGAHYYLELRRLFQVEKKQDKGPERIEREDYIRLVENLVRDFTAGVQENPRVRILANPWSNLKMIFSPSYSRTQRLGELYEDLIYRRVQDGEGDSERWLSDLYIRPVDEAKDFKPRRDNWARRCKVPELVLNATTLNSGHNWQFTASWMGESPVSVDTDVDCNKRYRRLYYRDAPAEHRRVRLGTAVGASSCVPGLFEPIILRNLYPRTTVRLVDGGVYDNQGVASLLEQDCNVIITSDAAGQLNTEAEPGGGIISPLLRSNSIMMHRVRGAQYEDLKARHGSALLKGFAFMHLKQGLAGGAEDWISCQEPAKEVPGKAQQTTDYGVNKRIQELLAGVRTDLDSFSDLESYALMTSGYLAAEKALPRLHSLPLASAQRHDWAFLEIEPGMKRKQNDQPDSRRLIEHLEVSPMTFFKVWKLYPPLRFTTLLIGTLLLAGLGYIWYTNPGLTLPQGAWEWLQQNLTVGNILSTLGLMLLGILLVNIAGRSAKVAMRVSQLRESLYRIFVGLGVGVVGWIGAWLHLHLFDRIFKRLGRVE